MSKLAFKLIAENKKTRSPFLDLGNCGLTEVLEAIGELVWLEGLSFSCSWREFDGRELLHKYSQNTGKANEIARLTPNSLSKIGPISSLIKLRKLFLGGHEHTPMTFNDLSPLLNLIHLQQLDVSRTQVADLSPLSGLTNLKQLDISRTQAADLSSLSGMTYLQQLYISRTPAADLSPLRNLTHLQKLLAWDTRVADLSPLRGLTHLQQINVLRAPLDDLSPLSDLINLQQLYISSAQVTDLSPLSSLIKMQRLQVSDMPVSDLSPLSDLVHLQSLDISYTQVSDLSPLSELTNLEKIDISNTLVFDLKPLIKLINNGLPVLWENSFFKDGHGIYAENCPLTNPSVEIVNQGNAAIRNYFHEKDTQGTDHLYEAKMLIIGEGGAGKTSLLRRLYQTEKTLPDEQETTKGIDICRHEFKLTNGHNFRLNVWDFGGQEVYHATHQFFLTKRSLYVMLDDTRKDDKTVHDPRFKYWLEVADLLGEHSPVLIFQNEKGGRSKTIDESGIKAKFNNVKDVYRGNLEHAGAADSLGKAIELHVQALPHIGEELPAKWIAIRADIEQQATYEPFISQQDYFDIYQNHLPFDRDKALHLSRYLHDLGVFLHFQDEPLLARTVILQNTWATEAVFKMLDDEIVKGKRGHFDSADCQRVWRESTYADMHPELLALMQKFELCYRLPDTNADNWLAPQLLPPSKPTELADWRQVDDLTLRYRYEFLPKGIISRLIVRMHRFVIHPDLSWVNGALFERGDTEVLAEVTDKGNEIVLHARGAERKELLSVISGDLDSLNDHFHGLKNLVSKWVPCMCSRCRLLTEQEFFEQKRLLQRKKDGKLKIECPTSYEDVDVLELLDGIRVNQLPGWAKTDEDGVVKLLPEQLITQRTIKIFLASSSELREDRDAFDLYFRQQNDQLLKQGLYLQIVRWENFLDAMSETRLQDEYNKAVKACDIFVSLFFTKTGKFTEEEFNVAHQQFQVEKKPLIYTFFKSAQIDTNSISREIISLLDFKDKLAALGHFYTSYDNIEHLKRQFKDQLEKLRDTNL
jgi:internalin A